MRADPTGATYNDRLKVSLRGGRVIYLAYSHSERKYWIEWKLTPNEPLARRSRRMWLFHCPDLYRIVCGTRSTFSGHKQEDWHLDEVAVGMKWVKRNEVLAALAAN